MEEGPEIAQVRAWCDRAETHAWGRSVGIWQICGCPMDECGHAPGCWRPLGSCAAQACDENRWCRGRQPPLQAEVRQQGVGVGHLVPPETHAQPLSPAIDPLLHQCPPMWTGPRGGWAAPMASSPLTGLWFWAELPSTSGRLLNGVPESCAMHNPYSHVAKCTHRPGCVCGGGISWEVSSGPCRCVMSDNCPPSRCVPCGLAHGRVSLQAHIVLVSLSCQNKVPQTRGLRR